MAEWLEELLQGGGGEGDGGDILGLETGEEGVSEKIIVRQHMTKVMD